MEFEHKLSSENTVKLKDIKSEIKLQSWSDEIETNSAGGKQSKLETRCDLLPASAVKEVARILKVGAERYAPDNWRLIDCNSHLNHALEHIFNFLDKEGEYQKTTAVFREYDRREELSHAACRLLMALEMYLHNE